jgi:TfoX/Sxy family transcriptional regulator of competence genes
MPASNDQKINGMATKKEPKALNEKETLFDKLIATNPAIERKGDTNPYTSYNGNMFTILLKKERLGIRLGEKELAAFLKKYKAKLLEAYGAVMKEYAEVPDSLLKKTSELKPWLDASYQYVQTLKAKPTKKARK